METFAQCHGLPPNANIELREDSPNPTIVLHCDWPLAAPKPNTPKTSREVTLKLNSSATQMFLNADDGKRKVLDDRVQHIVQNYLKNDYQENDLQNKPFVIRIDRTDLK
jgi:hypothetical protein